MILPTAILISHLAGAPAFAPFQPEPVELQRARQLMVSKPHECVALTHLFLQREEKAVNQRAGRQSINRPHLTPHYRTPEQTQSAWQTQALCQANAGHLSKAQRILDKAIKRAQREQMPSAEAASLIIKAKLTLAQQDIEQTSNFLEQASALLTPEAPTSLMDALVLLQGNLYLYQGQYEQARDVLEPLRLHTQEQSRPRIQAWANYFLAENYLAQQQQELALARYLETLDLLDNYNQYYLKAITAEKAGSLHAILNKPEQAIHYANLAATEFERLDNSRLLIGSLLNLGQVTRQAQEADLALVYLFNALELATELGDSELIAQLYLEIGSSYRKLEMYGEARSYLSQARSRFRRSQDHAQLIDALVQLGQVHLAQQEYGLALLQLDNALQLAEQLNDISRLLAIHQQLAVLFEDSHNSKKALYHQQAYHHYYVQASQKNQLPHPDGGHTSEQQLQQARELSNVRQQYNELKKERRYFSRAALLLSLILPLCLYGWHLSRRRYQQLQQQNSDLQHELLTDYKTSLPNWRHLMQRLPSDMAKSQLRSEQWYLSDKHAQPFNERMYYLLLRVPFMVDTSERIGLSNATALQKELGAYLQGRLHPQAQLYDVRDGLFIYVISQRYVSNLSHTIKSLVRTFAEFPSTFKLDTRLSIGIVGHPFLSKAPHALDDMRLGDILFLALAAAHQLSLTTEEATWVELSALDCQQAAFFTGDIRYCSIQAILKGLVKVNSSHPKQPIDWPALAPDLDITL